MLLRPVVLPLLAAIGACAGPTATADGGNRDASPVVDAVASDAPTSDALADCPTDDAATCTPNPRFAGSCTAVMAVDTRTNTPIEYTLDCCGGAGEPVCSTVEHSTEDDLRTAAGVPPDATLLFWGTTAVFHEGSTAAEARLVVFDGIFDRVALDWSPMKTLTPSTWMSAAELGYGCEPTLYEDTVGFDAVTGNPLGPAVLDELRALVMDTELPSELPGFGTPAPLFVVVDTGDLAYVVLTAIYFS